MNSVLCCSALGWEALFKSLAFIFPHNHHFPPFFLFRALAIAWTPSSLAWAAPPPCRRSSATPPPPSTCASPAAPCGPSAGSSPTSGAGSASSAGSWRRRLRCCRSSRSDTTGSWSGRTTWRRGWTTCSTDRSSRRSRTEDRDSRTNYRSVQEGANFLSGEGGGKGTFKGLFFTVSSVSCIEKSVATFEVHFASFLTLAPSLLLPPPSLPAVATDNGWRMEANYSPRLGSSFWVGGRVGWAGVVISVLLPFFFPDLTFALMQSSQGFATKGSLTQPPTVGCKMEAQLEYIHIAYTFLQAWRRFVSSVGDY